MSSSVYGGAGTVWLPLSRATDVGNAGVGEVGGQPDVAVVEADDVEAVVRELDAEPFVPAQHLGGQAHDEQEGRVRGVAEGLVGDHQVADCCSLGHAVSSAGVSELPQSAVEWGLGDTNLAPLYPTVYGQHHLRVG